MKTMFTKLSMYREGHNPIYSESVTDIYVDDEGGGMYITIAQHPDSGTQEIRFDTDEIDDFIKNLKYMKEMIEKHEGVINENL